MQLEYPCFQPISASLSPKHERNCVFMGISADSCPPRRHDVLSFKNGIEGFVNRAYTADDVQMYELLCRDTETISQLAEAVRLNIDTKTSATVRLNTTPEGSDNDN